MDNMQDKDDKSYLTNLSQGMKEGVNSDMDAVKDYLMNMFGDKMQNGVPGMSPTLPGLQGLANQAAGDTGNLPPAANRVSTDNAFADGGIVGDDSPDSQVPQLSFDPKSGLPPAPPPQAAPVAASPDISNYVAQQKQQINQYGPEQSQAVANHVLQQQNGLGGNIANAGAGFADAIMQGVARAGNPGFQQNLQNRQDKQAQIQLDALKNSREGNLQNVEAGQKLDAQDPSSALSASKRAQNGPILAAMGFNPATVGKMSAAEMDTTLQILKDFRGKDLETAVARYKAQIEANQLAETSRHNRTEEGSKQTELKQVEEKNKAEQGLKGEEIKTGELEKSAAEPFLSRLAGVVGLNPAGKALQNQALDGTSAHPDDARAIAYATDPKTRNTPQAAKIRALNGIQ